MKPDFLTEAMKLAVTEADAERDLEYYLAVIRTPGLWQDRGDGSGVMYHHSPVHGVVEFPAGMVERCVAVIRGRSE